LPAPPTARGAEGRRRPPRRLRAGPGPRLEVRDNGPGIPPEIQPQIFDPFFTTKPPGQGTGLGLDITRRLLRRYHGEIAVQSRPGLTEFRVSLVVERPVAGGAGHPRGESDPA